MNELDVYIKLLRGRWETPAGKSWRSNIIHSLQGDKVWGGNLDIRGINLSSLDLSGCDLTAAVLDFAIMDSVDLTGACLQRASLMKVYLCNSNLTNADFSWSDLRGCDMIGVKLQNTDFGQALTGEIMAEPPKQVIGYGYHLTPIKKGVYGESSKIREELDELEDAETQGIKLMVLMELADIYGALEACAKSYGTSVEELKQMSDVTKRAFESGQRK